MRSNIKLSCLSTILVSTCLMQGCASITSSSGQALAIETVTIDQQLLTGAHCKLSNDKGNWSVTTPATITVQKSAADLIVLCDKEGLEPGTVRAISRASAGMLGNAIIGGGVGAIIDHHKGTAYNYPGVIKVTMGESNTCPPSKKQLKKNK